MSIGPQGPVTLESRTFLPSGNRQTLDWEEASRRACPPGAPSACFLPTALGGASDGEPGSALFLSPRCRPLHPGKERQSTATQQTAKIISTLPMPETLPGGTAEHSAFHRGANGIRKSCQRIARHTARKPAADNYNPCLTRLPMKRNGQTSPARATVSHWKRACRNAPPGASSACFFSKALGRAFFMEHPTGAPFLLPTPCGCLTPENQNLKT